MEIYVKLYICEELYNLNDIRQAPRLWPGFLPAVAVCPTVSLYFN